MEIDTEDSVDTTRGRLGSTLLTLIFSVSTIGALLYLLGKSRIQSMQVMLGMPAGIVDSSPIDYATAGVDVALPFFTSAALVLLLGIAVQRTVVRPALARPPRDRAHRIVRCTLVISTVLASLGLGLVAIGLFAQDSIGRPLGLVLPVVLTASAGVLAYRWAAPGQRLDSSDRLLYNLFISLAIVGVLWSGALYGDATGRRFAEHFATNAAKQAEVEILSRDRLQLVGYAVTVEELPYTKDTDYRYCYRGLRYLMKSDKFYIFVAAYWRMGAPDDLYYVPTTAEIRLDTKRADKDQPRSAKCSER